MRRFAALVTVVSLCLGFVLSAHTSALTPPAAPSGYIRDDARVILDETEKRLEAKLADYEKEDGTKSSQTFACTGDVCEIVDIP